MTKDKKNLHLNVKRKWFNQIKAGKKTKELRLFKPYWQKRLINRVYDEIHIKNGYKKDGEVLRFLWNGCTTEITIHEEFGPEPVKVFSINLNLPLPQCQACYPVGTAVQWLTIIDEKMTRLTGHITYAFYFPPFDDEPCYNAIGTSIKDIPYKAMVYHSGLERLSSEQKKHLP